MNESKSIKHEPRVLYLPVEFSGRLDQAPIIQTIYFADMCSLWVFAPITSAL
jgi:hypothetical protein